jgi:hypothetical protein
LITRFSPTRSGPWRTPSRRWRVVRASGDLTKQKNAEAFRRMAEQSSGDPVMTTGAHADVEAIEEAFVAQR